MAGTLNKVILTGRLGVTPELKYTAQGAPVTSFSLATDESYTDKTSNKVEQTEWHRIVVWQSQAEMSASFCRKDHRPGSEAGFRPGNDRISRDSADISPRS
ncbi:single-stranded DNA-binding protein [Desulfonatronum parangueonense]